MIPYGESVSLRIGTRPDTQMIFDQVFDQYVPKANEPE